MKTIGKEVCEEYCPGTPLICTRNINHKGNHIAKGIYGKKLAEWNKEEVIEIDYAWEDSIPKRYIKDDE